MKKICISKTRFVKKALCVVFAAVMLLSFGCSKGEQTDQSAAIGGEADEIGMEVLSASDCLNLLNESNPESVKNVILLVGDGMSQSEIEMAKIMFADECSVSPGILAMESLMNVGENNTLCATASNPEPDSASGGTALACGYKSLRKYLGLDYEKNSVKNVVELAKEYSKSSGIVTNESITDATPAAFTVHLSSRDDEKLVAQEQIVNSAADIIIGGGSTVYTEATSAEYEEGVTYEQYMASNNITWAKDWESVQNYQTSDGSRLIATLKDDYFASYSDKPSLADMTAEALSILSEDEDGFFLMVEGGAMDESAHNADIVETCHQIIEFDKAVVEAIRFAAGNPDTMIIVTSDHDTGGCMLAEDAAAYIEANQATNENVQACVEYTEELSEKYGQDLTALEYRYTTIAHTNSNVPIYAYGYGTEIFNGSEVETYQIGQAIGYAISGQSFGAATATGLK